MATSEQSDSRLAKLRELHLRRNEARKLNHEEVVEEDRREKMPANWENRKQRAEWLLEEAKARDEAVAAGEDYDQKKLLDMPADMAEKVSQAKKRKKNPDVGFSDYEQATARQYNRLTGNIKPDMSAYQKSKAKLGEDFYPTANSLIIGKHKDDKESIDRMVADLEKQCSKRSSYNRRRPYDPDAGIDYINDRNQKFNKKLERFYGKYTTEIKQNLERGTAV